MVTDKSPGLLGRMTSASEYVASGAVIQLETRDCSARPSKSRPLKNVNAWRANNRCGNADALLASLIAAVLPRIWSETHKKVFAVWRNCAN